MTLTVRGVSNKHCKSVGSVLVSISRSSVLVLFKHPDAFIIADLCTCPNSLQLSSIAATVTGVPYSIMGNTNAL